MGQLTGLWWWLLVVYSSHCLENKRERCVVTVETVVEGGGLHAHVEFNLSRVQRLVASTFPLFPHYASAARADARACSRAPCCGGMPLASYLAHYSTFPRSSASHLASFLSLVFSLSPPLLIWRTDTTLAAPATPRYLSCLLLLSDLVGRATLCIQVNCLPHAARKRQAVIIHLLLGTSCRAFFLPDLVDGGEWGVVILLAHPRDGSWHSPSSNL